MVLSDLFEVADCFVEIASRNSSQLLLAIEQLDIPIEDVHRGQIFQSVVIPSKYLIRQHVHVDHTLSVVKVFVNIEKCCVDVQCLIHSLHCLGEIIICHDFLHIGVVFVLSHPATLTRTNFRGIGTEKIARIPRVHNAFFYVNGEGVIGASTREDVS